MEIAERLGKSVSEAKSCVTVTEFWGWQLKFKQDRERDTKLDILLAEIAWEVYHFRVKTWGLDEKEKPRTFSDFLPKPDGHQEKKEPTPEEIKDKVDKEKAVWLAWVGIKDPKQG